LIVFAAAESASFTRHRHRSLHCRYFRNAATADGSYDITPEERCAALEGCAYSEDTNSCIMTPPGNECDVKDADGSVLAAAFDGVCSDICCPDLPSLDPDGQCSDTQDCVDSCSFAYNGECDEQRLENGDVDPDADPTMARCDLGTDTYDCVTFPAIEAARQAAAPRCARHADCDMGSYCDSTGFCWTCNVISVGNPSICSLQLRTKAKRDPRVSCILTVCSLANILRRSRLRLCVGRVPHPMPRQCEYHKLAYHCRMFQVLL
jgi:hypothetical protein